MPVLRRPPQNRIHTTPEPDRDRPLDWQRINTGMLDAVEFPFERHGTLGPQPLHEVDLFRLAPTAYMPVLPERLIFDRVPSNADAEA